MCFILAHKNPFRKPRGQISVSLDNLEYLACGKSSVVYGIDEKRVLKEYTDPLEKESITEKQGYARLGQHPNIAIYLGDTPNGSIVLERGQVLRGVCRQPGADQISIQEKLHWLKDAAKGLRHVHNKGIIHCDVGCHNAILVKCGRLRIIDFEGCSIDGSEAGSCYEWFSYRRSTPTVSIQTDIFAYGCMVYEIMTGNSPYEEELEKCSHRTHLVEQRYENNQFPDIENQLLGELMHGCWHGTISSMGEVIKILQREIRFNSGDRAFSVEKRAFARQYRTKKLALIKRYLQGIRR